MKKLTVIVLSALLPMSLAFAGQEPIPVNDLDYAFAGEVLVAEPLSESEMEAVEGEFVVGRVGRRHCPLHHGGCRPDRLSGWGLHAPVIGKPKPRHLINGICMLIVGLALPASAVSVARHSKCAAGTALAYGRRPTPEGRVWRSGDAGQPKPPLLPSNRRWLAARLCGSVLCGCRLAADRVWPKSARGEKFLLQRAEQ